MLGLREFVQKFHAPTWLALLIAAILILRIPSFFEPYYYGDEMIYLTLGQGVRQGIPLYSELHDNKPPAIYLLAALAGNLFWFKVLLAGANIASVVFFWKLSKVLFPKKERLGKVATILFGLFSTLPLLEGNTVNSELLMIAPTLAAFWLLLTPNSFRGLPFRRLFLVGALFSLASLFKIPAAFDFPVILVFWLIVGGLRLKNIKTFITNSFYLALGYLLPIALTFVWYYFKGVFGEYLVAAYLQNVGYLSSFRPEDVREPFFVRNLPLLIRAGVVVTGIGVVTLFRKKLSKQFVFLSVWLLFALFAVTLSERPYPHYLVQTLPAVSFLFAILITEKTLEQSLAVIPLALFFFVPTFYNFWIYPTGAYYLRFINFAAGRMTRAEYFSGFSPSVNRNYQLAEFINSSVGPDEDLFVWGEDSPTVYALSRRLPPVKYVADYHVFDYSSPAELTARLSQKKPGFVIVLSNSRPSPDLAGLVRRNYLLIDNVKGAEIWRLSK